MLRKIYHIVSDVKQGNNKYLKLMHKFGIEVPKTVAEAIYLDKNNGNNLWKEAIKKKIKNVRESLKIIAEGGKPPPGYQKIPYHMIFDIKMEDFRLTAILVAVGHVTKLPDTITYEIVVLRETVCIALTVAALNDLKLKISDIQNTYINAPLADKILTVLGPEFCPDAGKSAVFVRALYGLKSSGDSFWNKLDNCMKNMEDMPCPEDPYLWMEPMV